MKVTFTLNGKKTTIDVSPEKRLIDILRQDLGLCGTKKGCEQGECGGCLVFLNDNLVNSCLFPAFRLPDKEVITIEGYIQTKEYTIIEEAFMKKGITLCGFCAPGIVLSIANLLNHTRTYLPTHEEITNALSGHLCRCNGFLTLIDVVLEVFNISNRKKNARNR
ncbi:MAG: 2Fe-2S iron-sulfur cluster binding domain-containing protein [Spirochaetales bacterium]|nr:2Fe-2S iron-sulfur cluster binding domain-containing protein [Spirochaetales bacterium]